MTESDIQGHFILTQLAASFMLAYIASFCILVYGIFKIVTSLKLKKINRELPDVVK